MAIFVALLRAINVGGTGKLAMSELRALCEELGFTDVSTYIQSGNLVFRSPLARATIEKELEGALAKKMGKSVLVLLRSAAELEKLAEAMPFAGALPNQVLVLFLKRAPKKAELDSLQIVGREEVLLGKRELYAHFPDGMGRSKLKLPLADVGTGRNLNTVNKLLFMVHTLKT